MDAPDEYIRDACKIRKHNGDNQGMPIVFLPLQENNTANRKCVVFATSSV